MHRRLLNLALLALILAGTSASAWYISSGRLHDAEPVTNFSECWGRTGSAAQIDCVSDRLSAGARRVTDGATGDDRDARLLAYVRSAETAAREDRQLAGICHPAMHQLGRTEGTRAARANVAPTFPDGSSQLCTAGYVHGLAEGYLTGTPTADVAAVFPSLCHTTKAREGCAHGVGHALLRARADEAATPATLGALAGCRKLPGEFPTNCFNGVYMELAMRTGDQRVPPRAYAATCGSIPQVEDSLSCWGYMTLNLRTNDESIASAPTWCAKADLPGQFPCIEQYGRDLGVEGVGDCVQVDGPSVLQERCVDGAIGLQVGSGHVAKDEALARCDDVSDRRLGNYCRRAVGRYVKGRAAVESA